MNTSPGSGHVHGADTDIDRGGTDRLASTGDVHDVLRGLILNGSLEPGEELSQVELSRRLDVSRTPLREALKLLEREGLVVNTGRHKLVKASPLSMADLDDLYAMRVVGEGLAISITRPTLRQRDLDALRRELDITMSTTDAAARGRAHRRFHALLRTGGGPRLQDHLERMFEHAERYHRVFMEDEADGAPVEQKHREHLEILEACESGTARHARDLLIDHISDTAMTLMTRHRHAPFALPTAIAMAKSNAPAGVDESLSQA